MINQVRALEKRIETIKRKLSALGDMRPGSLSKQFNVCGNPTCRCKDPENPIKHGPYYQLSYTHKGRSKSEFVKKENLDAVKKQLQNYQQFKKLTADWVDLSLELAKLRKSAEKG
jgi:hypothetical protein